LKQTGALLNTNIPSKKFVFVFKDVLHARCLAKVSEGFSFHLSNISTQFLLGYSQRFKFISNQVKLLLLVLVLLVESFRILRR
jgi:hypothetical protein